MQLSIETNLHSVSSSNFGEFLGSAFSASFQISQSLFTTNQNVYRGALMYEEEVSRHDAAVYRLREILGEEFHDLNDDEKTTMVKTAGVLDFGNQEMLYAAYTVSLY